MCFELVYHLGHITRRSCFKMSKTKKQLLLRSPFTNWSVGCFVAFAGDWIGLAGGRIQVEDSEISYEIVHERVLIYCAVKLRR